MANEDLDDETPNPWVVGVRLGPELAEKLKRMIEKQEASAPGQRVSAGGVLRGLLKEAQEP